MLRAGRRLLQFRQQRVGRGDDVGPLGRLALGHRLGDLQLAAFRIRLRLQPLGRLGHRIAGPERDLAGAKAAFQRALAIFERAYGPDHPNTRIARENLDFAMR